MEEVRTPIFRPSIARPQFLVMTGPLALLATLTAIKGPPLISPTGTVKLGRQVSRLPTLDPVKPAEKAVADGSLIAPDAARVHRGHGTILSLPGVLYVASSKMATEMSVRAPPTCPTRGHRQAWRQTHGTTRKTDNSHPPKLPLAEKMPISPACSTKKLDTRSYDLDRDYTRYTAEGAYHWCYRACVTGLRRSTAHLVHPEQRMAARPCNGDRSPVE